MKILALSTATEYCSVALSIDNVISERCSLAPREHLKNILPIINDLLLKTGITLKDLDILAVNHGPGNFISLRIGMGIAKGLAFGCNLPLVGISTLEILAEGIWRIVGAKQVCVIIDAYMREFYYALCVRRNNCWFVNNNKKIASASKINDIILQLKDDWFLVSTSYKIYYMFVCMNRYQTILGKTVNPPLARDMILLAKQKYHVGLAMQAIDIEPMYLRYV